MGESMTEKTFTDEEVKTELEVWEDLPAEDHEQYTLFGANLNPLIWAAQQYLKAREAPKVNMNGILHEIKS